MASVSLGRRRKKKEHAYWKLDRARGFQCWRNGGRKLIRHGLVLPAAAKLPDVVVRADGAEDARSTDSGERCEVPRNPHLLKVLRSPHWHGPESAPRNAHQRAGLH